MWKNDEQYLSVGDLKQVLWRFFGWDGMKSGNMMIIGTTGIQIGIMMG